MLWAMMMTTIPPAMAAPPMRTSPAIGTLNPMTSAMTPATTARIPRPAQRDTTLLGFSLNQPRSTTWPSRALSNAATEVPNSGRSSGSM